MLLSGCCCCGGGGGGCCYFLHLPLRLTSTNSCFERLSCLLLNRKEQQPQSWSLKPPGPVNFELPEEPNRAHCSAQRSSCDTALGWGWAADPNESLPLFLLATSVNKLSHPSSTSSSAGLQFLRSCCPSRSFVHCQLLTIKYSEELALARLR